MLQNDSLLHKTDAYSEDWCYSCIAKARQGVCTPLLEMVFPFLTAAKITKDAVKLFSSPHICTSLPVQVVVSTVIKQIPIGQRENEGYTTAAECKVLTVRK